jgi:heat-inducible transcriptional repressor
VLNDRRRQVLQALVDRYISSATPVGSKVLVERYDLGCSPATVRNELAILEETGFVFSPHTSAGRVPTDSGYRSFVDGLLAEPATSDDAERSRLHSDLYAHAGEVDELLRETTQLLSHLTDYVAVVLAPTVSLARIRRIDLLSMSPRRALFVLITESGHVVNRSIELPEDASPERLAGVERALNAALSGKRATEVRPLRDAMHPGSAEDALHAVVIDEILDALVEADRDRLRHVGLPSLLAQPEFHDADRVRPVITALEDDVAMLDALADVLAARDVTVRIGHENRIDALGAVSIVATNYEAEGGDGIVGVVGPTRMDYRRAIAAVRAVAEGLSGAMERG